MEFKTLTSSLVLSLMLAGSQAIAMESEDGTKKGKTVPVTMTGTSEKPPVSLTEDDQQLIKKLREGQKNGPDEEAKEAEKKLNQKVAAMLERGEDVTSYLTAISEAMKPFEEPEIQKSAENAITKADWFTQSSFNPGAFQEMIAAAEAGDVQTVTTLAKKVKEEALARKNQNSAAVVPSPTPLTIKEKEAASGLWEFFFGKRANPDATAPVVTLTIGTPSEKSVGSGVPVITLKIDTPIEGAGSLTSSNSVQNETGTEEAAGTTPPVAPVQSHSFFSNFTFNPLNWFGGTGSTPVPVVADPTPPAPQGDNVSPDADKKDEPTGKLLGSEEIEQK